MRIYTIQNETYCVIFFAKMSKVKTNSTLRKIYVQSLAKTFFLPILFIRYSLKLIFCAFSVFFFFQNNFTTFQREWVLNFLSPLSDVFEYVFQPVATSFSNRIVSCNIFSFVLIWFVYFRFIMFNIVGTRIFICIFKMTITWIIETRVLFFKNSISRGEKE